MTRSFLAKLRACLTPKRSGLQFLLRTLLVLMTLVALWFAGQNRIQNDAAHRQARALERLERRWPDFEVVFDYQMAKPEPWSQADYDRADTQREPPGPKWLRRLIGEDYFRTAVYTPNFGSEDLPCLRDLPQLGGCVELSNMHDTDLPHLAVLPKLQGLNLTSCPKITDRGLRHLRSLTGLEELHLGSEVTGVGLSQLQQLPKLERIDFLWGATAAGLREALALPHLKELSLVWCEAIHDQELGELDRAPQLTKLFLHDLPITDDGLECLAKLPHLQDLEIWEAPVTADALQHLENLRELKCLRLTSVKMTDAGLEHLTRLSQLRELSLRLTGITPAGKQRLEQALPNTTVQVQEISP